MLFAVIYRYKAGTTEDDARRIRRRFVAWSPPAGVEVLSNYAFAGGGGVAVVEIDSPATLRECLAPFMAHLDFEVEPALTMSEALALSMEVDEWADGVN
jgi:hypothetical protein